MDNQSKLLNILHRLNPSQATHLRIFCYDNANFRHVYDQLTKETTDEQFYKWLVNHAFKHNISGKVISWLYNYNIIDENEKITMNDPQKIAFAIIAMTRQQSEDLFQEDRPDIATWLEFWRDLQFTWQQIFPHEGILTQQKLNNCYGKTPDQWQPLMGTDTIKNIIDSVCSNNIIKGKKEFYDFSQELLSKNRNVINFFNEEHGVLLIDAISLYHPDIRKIMLSLPVSCRDRTFSIVIPPLPYNNLSINLQLENILDDNVFHERIQDFSKEPQHIDYQFGLGDIRHLKQWLFTVMQWEFLRNIPQATVTWGNYRSSGFNDQIYGVVR